MTRLLTLSEEGPGDFGSAITQHLGLQTGDSVVVVEGDDYVLVKRAVVASPVRDFDELASRTRQRFEALGIEPQDVEDAVRWARGSS